ncbi:uncharacterized protein LOC103580645 [Microplitis demolitor]|uniref:uncharacterized protein LOC103580645 n=1 Tax=Microplitis demolitor TaxID=69319 RepID=UPI0004CD6B42|nr:uncharacterized protein LOC103580645 [Microplitis demolitor]
MNVYNGRPFYYLEETLRSRLESLTLSLRRIDNLHSFLVPYQHLAEDISTVCVTEFLNAKPITKLGMLILMDKIVREKYDTTPNLAAGIKEHLLVIFYDLKNYRQHADFRKFVNNILWAWEESKTCQNQIQDLKFVFNKL